MAVANEEVKMQSAKWSKGGIRNSEFGIRNSEFGIAKNPPFALRTPHSALRISPAPRRQPPAARRLLSTAYRLPPTAYQRRGVLLLVVLSMLILFVMIAVTYVLVASRQLSIGKSGFTAARTNGIGVDPPQALVDGAMMQVARGTNNPHSVLGGTMSLLEHYYGGPAGQPVLWGKVGTITPYVSGQILQIEAQPATTAPSLEKHQRYAQRHRGILRRLLTHHVERPGHRHQLAHCAAHDSLQRQQQRQSAHTRAAVQRPDGSRCS